MLGLDVSRAALLHALDSGRLWRVYRAVYALDGPLTGFGWTLAAALRCDGSARAFSAAVLHGLTTAWPATPQIIRLGHSGAKGANGIDLRHSLTLREADRSYRRGIPTTTMHRTIIDCPPPRRRRRQGDAAPGRAPAFDLRRLHRPGIPGTLRTVLERFVTGSGFTANELKARFLELCAEAGLPLPEIQRGFGDDRDELYIDFLWPDIGLAVETDGRESHHGFIAFGDDRARDRRLLRAGYITLRYTWNDIRHEPEMVKAELIEMHERFRRAA